MSCQMQNNTRPGIAWIKLDRCEWGSYPVDEGRCYLPHACMQCDNPECVPACPTGANYQNDDGITLTDYDLCCGCGDCVTACPYGARVFNESSDNYFAASSPAPYEAFGVQRQNVSEKCTFCEERTSSGGLPSCVVNCPGKARAFGDVEDPGDPIVQKIQNATQFGTTGFYFLKPAGMPANMIMSKVMAQRTTEPDQTEKEPGQEPGKEASSPGGVSPMVLGIGGAVVAAGVGAGIAVGMKRKNSKKEEGASNENN